LITGCSSGIGYTTAHKLREAGWQVFPTARSVADVERLRAEGFLAFQLDVRDSTSISAALAAVLEHTDGTLDALLNNAGYGQPGAIEDLTRTAWREQFETNVLGAAELTAHVVRIMRAQGRGRILFTSSVLGYAALPLRGAYNASKFALEGMVDTLRLELRGSGIEAILIEPGPIVARFRANSLAVLRQHVDMEASHHASSYSAMCKRLTAEGAAVQFTLPAEAVSAVVLKALTHARPPARYQVTFPAKLFKLLNRILPDRLLDALKARTF
jgi:NAD(P)-dependent dehydrogenase (short-subunit alcohol dehydrogenase family)